MTPPSTIIVLDGGVFQQRGTTEEIYARPANTFVAEFIGSSGMNIPKAQSDPAAFAASVTHVASATGAHAPALVGIRLETLSIRPAEAEETSTDGSPSSRISAPTACTRSI